MSHRRIKLTLDCDGVLTDIWTPTEAILKSYTDDELAPYANEYTSLERLKFFAEDFSFERDTDNFEITGLTTAQYKLLDAVWKDPRIFERVESMPDFKGGKTDNWLEYKLGQPCYSSPTWVEMAMSLDMLAEICDITIHTHVDESCVSARREWFEEKLIANMKNADSIRLLCDTGTVKSRLEGDIVVEDRLFNLLDANAEFKILRGCFHNQPTKHNRLIWSGFQASDVSYHKINPICVSTFSEMIETIYIEAKWRYDNDKR